MKVGLIIPNNLWISPYIRIYTRFLDSKSVPYELISWNRDGNDTPEGVQYNHPFPLKSIDKIREYQKYATFVKKEIRQSHLDGLIVFGSQMALLLAGFLKRSYKGKYIFDFRDLSVEQNRFLRRPIDKVLENSFANVVSSPGFIKCLPGNHDYLISHNFDIDKVKSSVSISSIASFEHKSITVLTIGALRDFSSNVQVIDALANEEGIEMRFVGKGPASDKLKDYCEEHKVNNVSFKGLYQKSEEERIVKESTFLNIFYPRRLSHDTAISNRFYNSLLHKKTMIVTKDTVQGDFAEKFNVGIAIDDCSSLRARMEEFLKQDAQSYAQRCNNLLESFLTDQDKFEASVSDFLKFLSGGG